MNKRLITWLAAIGFMSCVAYAQVQTTQPAALKPADNPEYLYWARFPGGASVTLQQNVNTAGYKTEREITFTLLELTPLQAVVEIKTVDIVATQRTYQPVERMTIPAQAPAEKAQSQPAEKNSLIRQPLIEKGEEKIEIGGHRLTCQTQKTTAQIGGSKVVTTVWTSNEVPGGMVKLQTVIEGEFQSTMEMLLAGFKTTGTPATNGTETPKSP